MALTAGLSFTTHGKTFSKIQNDSPTIRSSFNIHVPLILLNLDLNNNSIDENLDKMLKSYGVTIDQESKIEIHDENGFIDISCFNCLINNNDNEQSTNKGTDRRS